MLYLQTIICCVRVHASDSDRWTDRHGIATARPNIVRCALKTAAATAAIVIIVIP